MQDLNVGKLREMRVESCKVARADAAAGAAAAAGATAAAAGPVTYFSLLCVCLQYAQYLLVSGC